MKYILFILPIFVVFSCAHVDQPRTALDVLNASYYWTPVHADAFDDGGSIALGLVNEHGETIYLWASVMLFHEDKNMPQNLSLKTNYSDPNEIDVLPGSVLEKQLIELLDDLDVRSNYEFIVPLVENFKGLLTDRLNYVE